MTTEHKPHQELAAIIRERLAPCYCYDEADADSPRGVPAGSQKYDDALRPANEALDSLEEQLEAAREAERQALVAHASEKQAKHNSEAELRGLREQLRTAETTLAHAQRFIEHMDMGYRYAEWLERNSNPATSESPGSNPGRASREHGRAAGAAREFESPIPASSPASGQVTSGNQTGTKLPAPDSNQESSQS